MASFLKKMLSAAGLAQRGRLIDASTAIQRALKPLMPPASPLPPRRSPPAARFRSPTEAPPGADRASAPKQAHASGGRFGAGTFTQTAGTRAFKLFEPGGFDGEALPLVVMLHGCTQNADDFATGTRMNELAQQRGLFVLYPIQPPRSNANKCWNWFVPADQRRGAGEPSLIAGMTQQVMQTHAVDPARVYVAGLSAGAAMAAILAREYPDIYAAAGIHSGLPAGAAHDVGSAFSAMKSGTAEPAAWPASLARATPIRPGLEAWPSVMPLPATTVALEPKVGVEAMAFQGAPLIVFHGDADTTVNALNGMHAVEAVLGTTTWTPGRQSQPATNRERAFTRTVYRQAGQGDSVPSRAEHWVIEGAGHAWSGGAAAGSYTDPRGPDASAEMLRFFAEHPLLGEVEQQASPA